MRSEVPERYRIEEELGGGGMGSVYRATDTHLDRTVAIKMLNERLLTEESRTRLVREARAASALNHPHVCTVYEVSELGGWPCIVMEHVEGEALSQAIPPGGRPDLVLRYGIQIADALAHAHDRGVIHCDLKSANVMITREGRAKVLDFGLARRLRESQRELSTDPAGIETSGGVAGTLPYLSPQVLAGHSPEGRDDIWSLGVVLYELATGGRPFDGATRFQLATSIQRDAPAEMGGGVPPGLRAVILRCLARDPALRYQHAHEVRAALEAVRAHSGSLAAGRQRTTTAIASLALIVIAVLAGVAWSTGLLSAPPSTPGEAPESPLTVAVLPFANPSGDPELEYLSDGIAESVISSLARLPGKLKVISHSAVQPYRSARPDAAAIGEHLNVGAVLYGSVVQRNGVVSVVVELVSTRDRSLIWADRYHKVPRELIALQQDIATEISAALRLELSRADEEALRSQYPADSEAYLLYLKGQSYWYRFTPDDYRRSLDHFQQALKRDSRYALAHAGVARVLSTMAYEGLLPPLTYREVEAAASTALSIDKTLGHAHQALAQLKFAYEWNWAEAERDFRHALDLSPRDEGVHRYYGMFLRTQRRWDEAIAAMKQALAINPVSAETSKALGATYFWAGRHDLAIEQFEQTLRLDPTHAQTHDLLADVYAAKGMYAQALESRRTYLRLEGALAEADRMGHDSSEGGYRAAMRRLHQRYLEALQQAGPSQYISPMEYALTYIALGDTDQAFAMLHEALGQRAPWLSSLAADPAFDPLRSDPRFARLLAHIGIPAAPS